VVSLCLRSGLGVCCVTQFYAFRASSQAAEVHALHQAAKQGKPMQQGGVRVAANIVKVARFETYPLTTGGTGNVKFL